MATLAATAQAMSGFYLFILFAAGLCAYWILWIIYTRTLHPLAKVPGPWQASVSRAWYVRGVLRGDMEHVQRDLHRRHGPLVRIAPNEIAVSDPRAIKQIYPVQSPLTKTDFYSPWQNNSFSKYPDNFSCRDERLHSQRRRIVNHIYSMSNVLKSEEFIDKCSDLFIQRVGEYADANEELDLGMWLQMYAFDVIGELYFGRMFGFLEERGDHMQYIESLDWTMPVMVGVSVAPIYWRPFMYGSAILSSNVRKGLEAVTSIATSARSYVLKRQKALQDDPAGVESGRRDMMHQLFEIAREKGEKVDFGMSECQHEANAGLFAGSDTTAIALRSVFYFLLKNPTVYDDLQAELDRAAAAGILSSPVRYSEAIKLPFLCACIKEAMRLHPSVALTLPRHSPHGGMELCGTFIPEGYRIGMNAAVVQRDQSVFGKDADDFRPQRWLEGNATNMDKHMLIFGAGTRTCIGKNISLSEIHKLTPQILLNFRLELVEGAEWETMALWFNKQTGIRARLSRRKAGAAG